MKRVPFEAGHARADVFERFVGAFFRARGYGMEHLDPYVPGKPRIKPDPGDWRVTHPNKPTVIMDVKENGGLGWYPGFNTWTENDRIALTSIEQFHEEWVYAVVAPNFSVMGLVAPWRVPEDGIDCLRTRNHKDNTMVRIHKRHFKVHRICISGRRFQ